MKPKYLNFLKKLLIFTFILGLTGLLIGSFLPKEFISPTLPYLLFFFFSVTLIVHLILLKVTEKKGSGFVNFFMLLTFGKLLFFLTIILIYALLNRTDAVRFIISFFIIYVFYTAFEVVLSLSHTRTDSSKTID
jgi:drug/metabolite transporter (DMT)-like permease